MAFCDYIAHMGSDLTVVNAARVSFDKESDWDREVVNYLEEEGYSEYHVAIGLKEEDAKLIKYLAKHGHWTPFSHPQLTMRETVPIFVARQRFKHMVGFTYNEVSRRYVDSPPESYIPDVWRNRPTDGAKQGSEGVHHDTEGWSEDYRAYIQYAHSLYNEMVEDGVAPEQARMVLPQAMFTSYYVTGSLAAWARAYKQRIDNHAQKEIRDLAEEWNSIIAPLFPVSWKELTE